MGMMVFIGLGIKFVNLRTTQGSSRTTPMTQHGLIEDILSNLISVFIYKQTEKEKKLVRSNNQKTINYQIKRQKCNLRFKTIFLL